MVDFKNAKCEITDNREVCYNAGQTTALVLWYNTQQQSITRPEIALQISGMDGGRTCTGSCIKLWCGNMCRHFPKIMGSTSEQDNRKRERAAGQAGITDKAKARRGGGKVSVL